MRTYKGLIGKPKNENQILIGGTNPEGRHGLGVAKLGVDYWGAIYGQGKGLQGQFYGIITKDLRKKKHPSISIGYILYQLEELRVFAKNNPRRELLIAYSGTGVNLNGYTPAQMANMFAQIDWPLNVTFEEEFYKLMNK